MGRDAVDEFFDDFKERFCPLLRQLVREAVVEELEPVRDLLVRPASDAVPEMAQLVGALEVAKLLGEDLLTERKRGASAQKVYDLARRGLIPSVRPSPRRVRFDLAAVRRRLDEGCPARPYHRPENGAQEETACVVGRR